MSSPTFKQLEAFWWAASCANFSTAAERLHLSVSSLSKRISELESVLGERLFDRSGHRAVLTDAGERVLPAALDVMNAVASLRQVPHSGENLVGHCRFGVGDLSALTWLPSFVSKVRRLHPGLILEPIVEMGSVLESGIADGELDFAVVAGRSSRSSLVSVPVGAAHFTWTVHPDVDSSHASMPELLTRIPLITLPPGAGTTRLLDDWLLTYGVTLRERILCNSWGAIAGMLCEGIGTGFLPHGWLDPLGLNAIGLETPLRPLQYAVQWRRGDARPLILAMQHLIAEYVDFASAPRMTFAQSPVQRTKPRRKPVHRPSE